MNRSSSDILLLIKYWVPNPSLFTGGVCLYGTYHKSGRTGHRYAQNPVCHSSTWRIGFAQHIWPHAREKDKTLVSTPGP